MHSLESLVIFHREVLRVVNVKSRKGENGMKDSHAKGLLIGSCALFALELWYFRKQWSFLWNETTVRCVLVNGCVQEIETTEREALVMLKRGRVPLEKRSEVIRRPIGPINERTQKHDSEEVMLISEGGLPLPPWPKDIDAAVRVYYANKNGSLPGTFYVLPNPPSSNAQTASSV